MQIYTYSGESGTVEAVPGEQLGVEEYDSIMKRCAEKSLQKTFKR